MSFRNYTIIIGAVLLAFGGAFLVLAQADDPFAELTYPIPELGNCESREDCDTYCGQAENMEACLDYAEAHNLLPSEEIETARKMLATGETAGPGGCQGQEECEAYCDNMDHLEECILFAEQHDLIPQDELEEAKKVIAVIKQGIKPPPCGGKRECDIYCLSPEHMEECMKFAIAAGLMPPDELEDAEKMLAALKQGIKPPDCGGKEECDVYCSSPEHMEECMNFAIAAGFMPPEEIENAKKMLEALKKGVKPPNCHSEEECDIYCSQKEHMEECINFAVAAGFMTSEQAEMARKTGGKGPGGCKGEQECNAFCEDPANMQTCMAFALEYGLVPPEDAERMKKMLEYGFTGGPGGCNSEESCEAYCQQPENAEECIDFAVKMGDMSLEEAEGMIKEMEMIEKGPEMMPLPEGMEKPPGEMMGPEKMMGPQPGEGEMFFPSKGEQEMMPSPEEGKPYMPESGTEPEFKFEPSPEPGPEPQSFLHPFKMFLGSVAAALGF